MRNENIVSDSIKPFKRDFYSETDDFTYLGDGRLGGKARGLADIKDRIVSRCREGGFDPIEVNIPRLTVITTQYFDLFMERNKLYDIALSETDDERIAHHFLRAELPVELTGDLRALVTSIRLPLAVRSSSLLEDSLKSPFAGIYETKMIPNNQPDADKRYRKLTEAIKFVYASTFYNKARRYIEATPHSIKDEKMAVIIQEVVGIKHNRRFYPNISGVARSYNFYPTGNARPEEGVVSLALGLGKAIVEGENVWSYSPEHPEAVPPFGSVNDMMKQTQVNFWAVNMGNPPAYDPMKETEYLVNQSIAEADYDNALRYIASTYDYAADRVNIGIGTQGPRIINFAPLLQVNLLPVNRLIKSILELCEETFETKVEIEFAVSIDTQEKKVVRFGLLQVRPMAVSEEYVELEPTDLEPENVLAGSENVMGNGTIEGIRDVVYVDPEKFKLKDSRTAASEIAAMNRKLRKENRPYLLIGFGRWGSSDPWLGIPVSWGEISGANVIVEAQVTGITPDLSQGSHFFHNISNLGVNYFSLKQNETLPIDWKWLKGNEEIEAGNLVRHVRLDSPLKVKVDGRKRKGVILKCST
jgi:hypothetical protein